MSVSWAAIRSAGGIACANFRAGHSRVVQCARRCQCAGGDAATICHCFDAPGKQQILGKLGLLVRISQQLCFHRGRRNQEGVKFQLPHSQISFMVNICHPMFLAEVCNAAARIQQRDSIEMATAVRDRETSVFTRSAQSRPQSFSSFRFPVAMILSPHARRWDFRVSSREIAGACALAVGRKPSMQEWRPP